MEGAVTHFKGEEGEIMTCHRKFIMLKSRNSVPIQTFLKHKPPSAIRADFCEPASLCGWLSMQFLDTISGIEPVVKNLSPLAVVCVTR